VIAIVGGVLAGGVVDVPTETLLNVAVVRAEGLWLVTANPTYVVDAMVMVSEPMTCHVVPSEETDPVKTEPVRSIFTQRGAAPGILVLTLLPDVVRRRWNDRPLAAETSVNAFRDPALSVSRIITPAFDQTSTC
jgi:hypothetical protein